MRHSLSNEEDECSAEKEYSSILIAALFIFAIVIFFIVGGAFLEKRHFKIYLFHEANIAIGLGMLLTLPYYLVNHDKPDKHEHLLQEFEFNDIIFLYLILPPILFADGFNMRRRKFADNLFYILLFGILGTLLCFIIMTGLTLLVVTFGSIK
jgi:hypothetical protein